MKRKAQMEIMGLAIIVILLFLGMVFVIKFIVLKEPKEYKKEYIHTELASNIIGAMLYTTAENCSMVTFAKLFQDCAAGEPGSICCKPISCQTDNDYSCAYANTRASYMLEETLKELRIKYYFQVTDTDIKLGDPCPRQSDVKQKRYPLPLHGAKTIYVILDICG